MDRWLRRGIERLFRDTITVSNAAKPHEIAALIRRLSPQAVMTLRRFGPLGDGGYVMPNDMSGIAACLSPGVSTECGFDAEIADLGIDVLMADASVQGPVRDNPRFRFFQRFIDVAPSEHNMTLEQLAEHAPAGDLILQMDIEGAEYRVLTSLSDSLLRRFRIIVIEFHELDQMFSRFGHLTMRGTFDRLLDTHAVVHIHPNNNTPAVERHGLSVPPLMEFTFYRRDRFERADHIPQDAVQGLDFNCVPEKPPLPLPECWIQKAA